MPTVIKEKSIVKIAVKKEPGLGLLIEFDQSQPLNNIIKQLCNGWNIDDFEQYALQFSDHNSFKYVTEKNRNEVRNGSILLLEHSVDTTVRHIIDSLKKTMSSQSDFSVDFDVFQKLNYFSTDPTFAIEFINNEGVILITNLIQNNQLMDKYLARLLTSFTDLMDHGIISWDILEMNFIQNIIHLLFTVPSLSSNQIDDNFKILKACLQILENVILNSPNKYQEIEKDLTVTKLLMLIETLNFEEQKVNVIQQNILSLLNALILKSNSQKRRSIGIQFDFRPIQLILNHGYKIGTEMAHQLYVLQQLILNLLEIRMLQKMDIQDTESLDKIKELRKIAYDSDNNGFFSTLSGNDTVISRKQLNVKDYKKLGFKCDVNPVLDFTETPPGMLALDCMFYFARNHVEQYTKIVIENNCRADEHECPFGRTSIELVKLLCEIFHIGDQPNEQGENYHPICFSHDRPFEEIFSICINLVNKTWREMKATTEDFVKVFSVVREQITRALQKRPVDLDNFRNALKKLNYDEIFKLWQQERNSREEWESHAKPIVELKEQITPEILDLIKQRRLNFLCEGTRFSKYSNRGQRIKDKFLFIKLSSNYKVFHYGDCDEIIPPTEELSSKIAISDIKSLVIGKECPHMKDCKGRKGMHQLAFSLLLDSTELTSLNFVAHSDQVFTYWTDGINALLGYKMLSEETEKDLETLLSMEIKLRLLDVEGIDIPQEPPPVPNEPSNYDYYFINS